MRIWKAPTLLVAVIAAGCTDNAPTAQRLATPDIAERSATPSPVSRPFAGTCELTFTPAPLPPPPTFVSTDDGTCHFSELGKTDFHGVQTINFAAGTQSGQRTFTAANGDVLRIEHSGTSAPAGPGLIAFRATAWVVGGTGRFENATGQMTASGIANLVTHSSVANFEGEISYAASSRRNP
jgi:hypothetical protein